MIVKVQISKTWQEKQFEPFNLSLGFETQTHTDDPSALKSIMQVLADDLQATAQAIYDERRTFKA